MPSIPLVPRQSPIAPLNAEALQALADLQRQQKTAKRLTNHLNRVAEQISTSAVQLNERSANYTVEHGKKRRRAQANEEEENEEENTDYEAFQSKVQTLTRKLDNGVRSVVDDQTWLETLPEVLKNISEQANSAVEPPRRQTHPTNDDDEEEPTTAYPAAPSESETPLTLLQSAKTSHTSTWTAQTLTARYSQHNTYVGFYRSVHDARNPHEDAPPLPHHSLWFAAEEDVKASYVPPGTQPQRLRNDEGSSSDIEIAREKISLKCPITLLPFTDPLTSTKCPHSFDSPGILDMLRQTGTFLPLTDEQTAQLARIPDARARARKDRELRTLAVMCPVCSVLLSRDDLRPDPVLLRKVKRHLEREKREREAAARGLDSDSDGSEESEDEDGIVVSGRGTQRRPVGVGSSPPPPSETKRKSALEIKRERERARSKSRGISVVPATQLGGDEE
jgi:E3 SUMO-protein ligase NSE2